MIFSRSRAPVGMFRGDDTMVGWPHATGLRQSLGSDSSPTLNFMLLPAFGTPVCAILWLFETVQMRRKPMGAPLACQCATATHNNPTDCISDQRFVP